MARVLIRAIEPHGEPERPDPLLVAQKEFPSWLELPTMLRATKLIDIYGPTPELRFTESDQTDPVGRYRWRGTGGSYTLEKAATAAWATSQALMSYDRLNTNWLFNALESNAWYIQLLAGVPGTPGTNAAIFVGGSTSGFAGVEIRTGNAVGSLVSRLLVNTAAGTPDIDIQNASLDLNANTIYGVGQLRGSGGTALYLRGWRATTDATAQRVIVDLLDPATDTVYQVAAAVPNAATPLWTMLAPTFTPTTTQLDASHLTFVVNASDQLVAYWNKAGAIKSLVVGTLA